MKSLQDYEKFRRFAGWFLRNRRFQATRARLRTIEYLNAGCGPQIAFGFVNLDYRWVPGVDIVWDLDRPLPFPPARFRGIFAEHCLEHFDMPSLMEILREFHRVLQPGGRVRIVVPSLEIHARAYMAAIEQRGTCTTAKAAAVAAQTINEVFYAGHDTMKRSHWNNDGHHFIHDQATLSACLANVGFADVRPAEYGQGADPKLLIDQPDRAWESLYVEAAKPKTHASL